MAALGCGMEEVDDSRGRRGRVRAGELRRDGEHGANETTTGDAEHHPWRAVAGPDRVRAWGHRGSRTGLVSGAPRLADAGRRAQPEGRSRPMSDKQVVLAIFESEAAADAAVEALKDWDK